MVVKADGLAAGKGVVVATARAEAKRGGARDARGATLRRRRARAWSIEELLVGREVSVLALTDGKRLVALPAAEDHKTIFDGDRGPNTGGMGTVSPTPALDDAGVARATREILEPTVRGLAADGIAIAACSTPA